MVEPVRLTVLKKLTEHLEGVSVANGYNFDLKDAVFRGRTLYGDSDPVDMVSIIEDPRQDEGIFVGENFLNRYDHWTLFIQGRCAGTGEHTIDNGYFLANDLEIRLRELVAVDSGSGFPKYKTLYMMGGLITDLVIGQSVVRLPQDSTSANCFVFLPIKVGLASMSV